MDLIQAQKLLNKYVTNERLKEHCLQVGRVMRFFATKLKEDTEKWELTGILHDLDWEVYPEQHPNEISNILKNESFNIIPEIMEAILGHAYPERTSTPRKTQLSKYLFACDEITGFITAYSLMKGGISNVTANSVVKKLKDKAFARGVKREDVYSSVEDIQVDLLSHIEDIITALQS